MKDFYFKIRTLFGLTSQSWLLNKIPCGWTSKTDLIQIVLFEALIDFVEKKAGIDYLNIADFADRPEFAEAEQELVKAYWLITEKIPSLNKEIDTLYESPAAQVYFDTLFNSILEENGEFNTSTEIEEVRTARELVSLVETLEQEVAEIVTKYRKFLI